MRAAAAIVCVLVTVGTFVFLHTGSRAAALCARYGAAVPDGLSAWPPGARCSGGLPVQTKVAFDGPTTLLVIPSVVLLAFGAAALTVPAQHDPR